jgi:5-methylcytosine-specific restriction enzyme subunit McrC
MRQLSVHERQWREFDLTPAELAELRGSGFVEVASGSRRGSWRIRGTKYVGAAQIGSTDPIEVRIEPKVTVDRLLFLVGYAQQQQRWRQEEIGVLEAPDLLPATAHAFARAADRALREGVLLGYREIDAPLPQVLGRIRESDQLRVRYGFPLPVEVRYDDFTPDIAENQLLLAAAHRLLRLTDIYAQTRKSLHHLLVRLTGVKRLAPGRPLPRWYPTRLNRRYSTALGLAELVLRGASYELDGSDHLRADGLLVLNMWKVFEDFVTAGLTRALRPYGGECSPQDKRHHLDDAHLFQLIPDLVYDRPRQDGVQAPAAVIDAKYVIETGSSAHRDHIYQVLAYCTAARVNRGYVIYAEGPKQPTVHQIHGTDIEIVQYPLDLSRSPAELLSQLAKLAARIAGTTSVSLPGNAPGDPGT